MAVCVAHRAHRGHDAGLAASLAKCIARVLATAIGMMDVCPWLALRDRHVQGRQNQFRAQVRLHRPAHDPTRVHVEHHCQIQKSGPSRDVGDVSQPTADQDRRCRTAAPRELPHAAPAIRLRRHDVPTQTGAPQACSANQSSDALSAGTDLIVISELGMNVRRAVDASTARWTRRSPKRRSIAWAVCIRSKIISAVVRPISAWPLVNDTRCRRSAHCRPG